MNIEEDIKIKLQTIEERLNTQKEVIIQEIIDIIEEDIVNNKIVPISEIYESTTKIVNYKCKTKYKDYNIKIDDIGNIILFKGYLWWKEEIIIYQLSVLNNQKLLDILDNKYIIIKLMEN